MTLLFFLAGTTSRPAPAPAIAAVDLPSPAGAGSSEPDLAVDPAGVPYLSWVEARGSGHALLWSRYEKGQWTKPREITASDSLMINWADFPILLPLGGGRLAASWASRRGEGYEVRLSYSKDGMRWTRPVVPHRDGTPTEHGFVSLLAEGDGARVMWLDGRSPAGTSLRTTVLHPDGSVDPERALDPRVCDCCQTSALRVGADVVVAYRDRSPNETRDISLVRFRGHGAKEIASAPPDGWRIDGCPVNGPALATRGGSLALAWFAAPRDRAQVRVALSRDGGRSFGPPTRVDEGSPLGRVQVQLGSDGSAFVSWVEAKPERALVLARRVSAGGVLDPPMVVARAGMARGLGYPRMARSGSRLLFAWTEPGAATRVRVAMLDAPGRPAGL